MSLRPDGSYQGRIDLGLSEDGKRKAKYVYAKTEAECIEKMHAVRQAVAKGVYVLAKRIKVGAYLDHWLAEVVTPRCRPGTVQSYEGIIRIHLKPGLGNIELAKLDVPVVRRFLNSRVKLEFGGCSPRHVQLMRSVLCAALNQAVRDDLIPRNVVSVGCQSPKVKQGKRQFLDVDQARTLIKAAEADQHGALFVTAMATGCRLGELLALRWADIDLDGGFVRVNKQLQRVRGPVGKGGGKLIDVEPKTERSNRTLPLPPFAVSFLSKHRERSKAIASKRRIEWSDDLHVFGSERLGPTEPRNATRTFKSFLATAELPLIRFHDLRHSCASLMLSQGADLRTIMQHLGHSQIALTANTYTHVMPQLQREAANRLQLIVVPDDAHCQEA